MLIKYKTVSKEFHTEVDETIGNYFKVNSESYLHCLDGPAVIFKWMYSNVNENGTSQYYINGFKYTKTDWEIEVNRLKMLEEL